MEFSLRNILYSLKNLSATETGSLAIHLGVELNFIVDCIVTPQNGDIAKAQYVQRWLDIDIKASRKELARALRKIDKLVLAADIESTYHQANVVAPPTDSPQAHEQVVRRVPTAPTPDASIPDINPIHLQTMSQDKVAGVKQSNPDINPTELPAMREAGVKESIDSNPDINPTELPAMREAGVKQSNPDINPTELPAMREAGVKKSIDSNPDINPTELPAMREAGVKQSNPDINPTELPAMREAGVKQSNPDINPTELPAMREAGVKESIDSNPDINPTELPAMREAGVKESIDSNPDINPTELPAMREAGVKESIDSNPDINPTELPAMREAGVKESIDIGQTSNPDINLIQLPVVSQVKASIDQLEDKFSCIKSDTRRFLSTKGKSNLLDSFIDHLLDLPASKRLVHLKLFCDSEVDIIEARSFRKLLSIVHCYCDSFNYDLILPVIVMFATQQHKQCMLAYQESRQKFEMETSIDAYVWAISAHSKGVTFKGFHKMGIRINRKPTECTVHEIRQLDR